MYIGKSLENNICTFSKSKDENVSKNITCGL